MDGLFLAFGLHYWVFAKLVLLLLATGLVIWFIWRRTKRPGIRRATAMGLPLLLFIDIIPSNAMLAHLCANYSGVIVNDRAAAPISVAVSEWASRGGMVLSAVLGRFGELQIEVREDRTFRGDGGPSLEAGFYQLTMVENTDPQCRDDWNLVSAYVPEGMCVQADKIDGFTTSHLIGLEVWKRLGIWAREVTITDRRTGDVLGMASQYTRLKGYSWSGMSIFFGEGEATSAQRCPEHLGADSFRQLLSEVLFEAG